MNVKINLLLLVVIAVAFSISALLLPKSMLGFLISIAYLVFILVVGCACLQIFSKKRNLNDLQLVLAPGIGIALSAFIFIIARLLFLNVLPEFTLMTSVAVFVLSAVVIIRQRSNFNWRSLQDNQYLSVFLLMAVSFLAIHLYVNLPYQPFPQPDGAYVYKNNNLHVRIQDLTGDLPADNYLPFVVSQFMTQGLSFSENRPLMPGQEVTNRTALMSLSSSQFLSFLNPEQVDADGKTGTFQYLSVDWSDSEQFGFDNRGFYIFFALAIVMNSIFILPVFLIAKKLFHSNVAFITAAGLVLLPFVFNQIIFTWPKFMMGYFLINALALWFIGKKRNPFIIGLMLSLAYHSHPSSLIYILMIGLYFVVKKLLERQSFLSMVSYFMKMGATLLVVLGPWFIWSALILKIPSDLITQNLLSDSYTLGHLLNVRLENVANLLFIWQFEASNLTNRIYNESILSVPGSILLFAIPAYYYTIKYIRKYTLEILILGLAPILLLSLVWGRTGFPMSILFSQPTIPILYLLSVGIFLKNKLFGGLLLAVQFVIFEFVLWFSMYNLRIQTDRNLFAMAIIVGLHGIIFLLILFKLQTTSRRELGDYKIAL
ncbi:MAG: glycosyltransferase family 39 protein [Bacteroidota bacterium]|nr:glycosyltransferase family 39 protein [Bacteroidota bacterium]